VSAINVFAINAINDSNVIFVFNYYKFI